MKVRIPVHKRASNGNFVDSKDGADTLFLCKKGIKRWLLDDPTAMVLTNVKPKDMKGVFVWRATQREAFAYGERLSNGYLTYETICIKTEHYKIPKKGDIYVWFEC